jgi:hypothetical protein
MEDKIKVHEQLLELLNEKYITRGEYLISLKENLFTLKDRIKIHEQLDELLKNDYITKDEYLIFIKENLNSGEVANANFSNKQTNGDNSEIEKNKIERIKDAGISVEGIYYLIIIEIIISQIYDLLLDVKIEYFKKQNGFTENYSEINSITKWILDSSYIDIIVDYLEYMNEIYYFIQLILFLIFLGYLWNIGVNLKNVDKPILS